MTLVLIALLGTFFVMYILYLINLMPAIAILITQNTINMIAPVLVIALMLWFQCKFSGLPNTKFGAEKVKYMTLAVLIWSIARVLSSVNGMFLSRQALEIVRCWQNSNLDDNNFLSMETIAIYLLAEIIPIMIISDSNFLLVLCSLNDKNLTEPFFQSIHGDRNYDSRSLELTTLDRGKDVESHTRHFH